MKAVREGPGGGAESTRLHRDFRDLVRQCWEECQTRSNEPPQDAPPGAPSAQRMCLDGGVLLQSDNISHIDMGDDRIDTVISSIMSPYPISISHTDLPYRYRIISCHSGLLDWASLFARSAIVPTSVPATSFHHTSNPHFQCSGTP
jgi:hypothetical protein